MGRSGKFRGKPRPKAAVRTVQSSPQGSAGAHSNPGSSSSISSPIKGGGSARVADVEAVGGNRGIMSGQAATSPSKDKGKGKMPLTSSNSTSLASSSSSSSSSASLSLTTNPALIAEYHAHMTDLLQTARKVLHISSTQNISIAAAMPPIAGWFEAAKWVTEDVLKKFGGQASGVGEGMVREMVDMAVRAREVLRESDEGGGGEGWGQKVK